MKAILMDIKTGVEFAQLDLASFNEMQSINGSWLELRLKGTARARVPAPDQALSASVVDGAGAEIAAYGGLKLQSYTYQVMDNPDAPQVVNNQLQLAIQP